jgi:hypothetical protein
MTGQIVPPSRLGLRVGDWVLVRSREEILSTLDKNGCLDGLPFQPEMLYFCGRRMRVAKVAHKTCNNIKKDEGRGRRMLDAVHLEGGRCDGAYHGACQADCVFFWKEAWLRREGDPPFEPARSGRRTEISIEQLTHDPGDDPEDPVWICQTTKLYEATIPLPWWDVRQYIRDVVTGNHTAWHMIKLLSFSWYRQLVGLGLGYSFLIRLYNSLQNLRGGKPFPVGEGKIEAGQRTPAEVLNLQPGEWVQVRSQDEILGTLTRDGFNRGLRYDVEMAQYCGGYYRVQMRVERLINEQTGKMMTMKNPCIQLENVFCRAECTQERIGCPRASNTYWREIWLRRISQQMRSES